MVHRLQQHNQKFHHQTNKNNKKKERKQTFNTFFFVFLTKLLSFQLCTDVLTCH